MPLRAFIDSDGSQVIRPIQYVAEKVLMPLRAFIDSDNRAML